MKRVDSPIARIFDGGRTREVAEKAISPNPKTRSPKPLKAKTISKN